MTQKELANINTAYHCLESKQIFEFVKLLRREGFYY